MLFDNVRVKKEEPVRGARLNGIVEGVSFLIGAIAVRRLYIIKWGMISLFREMLCKPLCN